MTAPLRKPKPSAARKRSLSVVVRRALLARDGGRCVKCGNDDGLQAHHVVDFADDGPDTLENLATLCGMCHAEWSWSWPQPRPIPFGAWLAIPPAYVVMNMLMLARDGVDIGIPSEVARKLLQKPLPDGDTSKGTENDPR